MFWRRNLDPLENDPELRELTERVDTVARKAELQALEVEQLKAAAGLQTYGRWRDIR